MPLFETVRLLTTDLAMSKTSSREDGGDEDGGVLSGGGGGQEKEAAAAATSSGAFGLISRSTQLEISCHMSAADPVLSSPSHVMFLFNNMSCPSHRRSRAQLATH